VAEPAEERTVDSQRILGLLLVVIGLMVGVALVTDASGELIVPTLGIAFLVAYAATRRYGLLIPGGILTGLGAGIVIATQGGPQASVVLGLGLGFVTIAVVDVLVGRDGRDGWWWPLIPGGILAVVGGSEVAGVHDAGRYLVPIALVVIGVLLLVRGRSTHDAGDGAASPTQPPTDPPPPPVA
jgi:hypothetical protein